MDEQCIDCGASFDIHNFKNGLCYTCRYDVFYGEEVSIEDEINYIELMGKVILEKLKTEKVKKMLNDGRVICLLNHEMYEIVKDSNIVLHQNLTLFENDNIEHGKVVFFKELF